LWDVSKKFKNGMSQQLVITKRGRDCLITPSMSINVNQNFFVASIMGAITKTIRLKQGENISLKLANNILKRSPK
jgi:hypothetical protein